MGGTRLVRTGHTWSSTCLIPRAILVWLSMTLLKILCFILLHHVLWSDLVFSPRNVRSCGFPRMIYRTRPHEKASLMIRCNDVRATLKCKPSITCDVRNDDSCFHGVDTVANVSLVLVDQRRHCGDVTCSHRHKDCVSEHEHDESHRRCRNARNDNHQFLFSHGQVQFSLVCRSKDYMIIKPHGDGSEGPLQE